MLSIDYDVRKGGWQNPEIIPFGKFSVPITATSLHYGISCYEGMNIVMNRETGKA
jgi:branched-chain amino acid aminotransferase